jgi:signal peptidase I
MKADENKVVREIRAIRDMVESVWVAIVLAFVLRAFMIEAFVIPTGSMAPRLLGRHCNLRCGTCGHEYACGLPDDGSSNSTPRTVDAGCPLCGESADGAQALPDGGDRVLVLKYLYHFREPRPWDVVVFRNPQNNRENYIKRLIGRPGESIEIIHGDIFVKPAADAEWKIRRKTPRAQKAMWHVLFDNDYRPPDELIKDGADAAPSWKPQPKASWKVGNDGRNFRFLGGPKPAELEFKAQRGHFFPGYGYNGTAPTTGPGSIDPDVDVCTDLKLSLVYIPQADDSRIELKLTSLSHRFKGEVRRDGTVGLWHRPDGSPDEAWRPWGQAKLQPRPLGRGVRVALSHVDFRVRLWVDGKVVLASTDQQYDANHDELRKPFLLRVLGEIRSDASQLVEQIRNLQREVGDLAGELGSGGGTASEVADQIRIQREEIRRLQGRLGNMRRRIGHFEAQLKQPIPSDSGRVRFAKPTVRLAASHGACELRHVVLRRDVYYTAATVESVPRRGGPLADYAGDIIKSVGAKRADGKLDAERWPGAGRLSHDQQEHGWGVAPYPLTLAKHRDHPDLDEFFVLGDNSPQSLDGRSWISAAPSLRMRTGQGVPQYQLGTVPRYNLIGKAFFVYWPAGFRLPVPFLEGLSIIPNVGRMRMIR